MIDFAYPVGLVAFIAAFPLDHWLTETQTLTAAAGIAVAALSVLWVRVRSVQVELVDEVVVTRNVFRTHRIPTSTIRAVDSRHCWFRGIYAFCFGVRTKRGIGA